MANVCSSLKCEDSKLFGAAHRASLEAGVGYDHRRVRKDLTRYRQDPARIPPYVASYIASIALPAPAHAYA